MSLSIPVGFYGNTSVNPTDVNKATAKHSISSSYIKTAVFAVAFFAGLVVGAAIAVAAFPAYVVPIAIGVGILAGVSVGLVDIAALVNQLAKNLSLNKKEKPLEISSPILLTTNSHVSTHQNVPKKMSDEEYKRLDSFFDSSFENVFTPTSVDSATLFQDVNKTMEEVDAQAADLFKELADLTFQDIDKTMAEIDAQAADLFTDLPVKQDESTIVQKKPQTMEKELEDHYKQSEDFGKSMAKAMTADTSQDSESVGFDAK